MKRLVIATGHLLVASRFDFLLSFRVDLFTAGHYPLLMFLFCCFSLGEPPVAHQGMMSRSNSKSPIGLEKSTKTITKVQSTAASAATAASSRRTSLVAVLLVAGLLLPHLASSAPTPQDEGKYTSEPAILIYDSLSLR